MLMTEEKLGSSQKRHEIDNLASTFGVNSIERIEQ